MPADRPEKTSKKYRAGSAELNRQRKNYAKEAGRSAQTSGRAHHGISKNGRSAGPSVGEQPAARHPNSFPSTSASLPSSSSEPQPSQPDIMKFFVKYKIPPIEKFKHTTSKRTRGPKFFDMHLHKDLRLKEVVILHRLPEALVQDCDRLARACQLTNENFPNISPQTTAVATNERDLVELYRLQVSSLYSSVASGLLFNSTDWRPAFQWTVDPHANAVPRTEALADAFLSLVSNRNHLPHQHQDDMALLEKYNLHHLIAWEFKSLTTGPEIMAMFHELEGAFQWTTCHERAEEDPEAPSSRCDAKTSRHRIRGRPVVTGRKTGPDSQYAARILETVRSLEPQPQRLAHVRSSLIQDDPITHADADRANAHDVLQQSWTEAVVDDLTFFVISCGNEENIAIRDRENQRLYLSSYIRPTNAFDPSHSKLHVGLYICAYFDALERARLLESMLTAGLPSVPSRYRLSLDRAPLTEKQAEIPIARRRALAAEIERTDKDIINAFLQSDSFSLRLHAAVLSAAATNTNVWIFRRQSPGSKDAVQNANEGNPQFFVDLEEKLDGKVFAVYLAQRPLDSTVQPQYHYSNRLVLGLAKTDVEIQALEQEYEAYIRCSSQGVDAFVPTYGHFYSLVRQGLQQKWQKYKEDVELGHSSILLNNSCGLTMLKPSDPFYRSLKAILEGRCNPEVLSSSEETVNSPQESPLTFHDRHLAKDLALENIVALPTVYQSLSKLCESAIETFLQSGHKFQEYGNGLVPGVPHRPVHDAAGALLYYQWQIHPVCHKLVSKLLFHPTFRDWDSVFIFHNEPLGDVPFALHGWLQISYNATRKKMYFTDKLDTFLDPALKDKLEDLARRYPELAVWQIFGKNPIALRLLKSVERDRKFSWEVPRTGGARTNAKTSRPRDANLGVLSKIFPKKYQRGKPRASAPNTDLLPVSDSFIRPATPGSRKNAYRADFCHYIQHAWARATPKDATFIIFNCGSHERVGIRHRETQTLFLSEPIDTVRVGYRKCHIGLYLAIVLDALERRKLAKDDAAATTLKRTQECLDDKEEVVSKRRKTSIPLPPEDLESLAKELSTRELVLIHLDYGVYRSPVPSSFIRVGSSCVPSLYNRLPSEKPMERYKAEQSFSLILGEPMGEGAVGVVHPASLEVSCSESTLKHRLLVKLAFSLESRNRLRREFRTYETLARRGIVRGIVNVHGLFEDSETGALALVMEDGGQNLRQREEERTNTENPEQVSTTDEEREAFIAIMNSLHEAGIRHRDIRADNMVVHPVTHQVSLIDFDCADEKLMQKTLAKEIQCMNDILDRSYEGQRYYSASPDPVPSDWSDSDEEFTGGRPPPNPPPLRAHYSFSLSPTPSGDDDEVAPPTTDDLFNLPVAENGTSDFEVRIHRPQT
ncbi:hypothetical protein NLJ89_g8254 [Agrocybe chaxingu]|uniref:Protein kinase domain-containing protein n=1 Tax=Agrocybe chaxingu TaxID=84603 RepID=A0A9W8JVK9_9AGAR|nr:hypothetical protein NLJ89_g8254 [Agrocybe chaxingu]